MANLISQVKLPNNTTYTIRDPNARPLSNNDFDTINVTELNAGDIIVTGAARFLNTINGNITTANKVNNDLKIQLNGGTTEGTNQFTYNGSATKNINITKSGIGLSNVENKSSATIRGELTSSNVTTALGYTPLNSNLKGASNGVAELDANGLVPSSQLPSYVDDVLEYSSKSAFPTTGETGKIYVATDTNLTYRWGGSAYTEISPSLALGETSSTAYRGDRGATAYSHATDSSRLTTATASGLYKVASTAQGHIASLTAVTKADITGLGIPGSDTNTHRPIQMNGTEILGNNTTALNLKAGTNVSLSNSSGTVTIASTDTNTTYSLSASGESVVLSGSDNSSKSVSLSTLINGLCEGSSPATSGDYIIAQYAGGGTTTNTYHRRKLSNVFKAMSSNDITTALGYTPPHEPVKDIPNTPTAIATFTDGANLPMPSLKVGIEPIQDLHGYDAPWVGGAGKNKFEADFTDTTMNGTAIHKLSDGRVTTSGVPTAAFDFVIGHLPLPAGSYILNGCPANGGTNKYRLQVTNYPVAESLGQDNGAGVSFTLDTDMEIAVRIQVYTGASASLEYKPMIRLSTVSDGTYEPYSNICPISGWDEVNVNVSGVNVWDEEWELGGILNTTGQNTTNNSTIRTKNYIPVVPNTQYYINSSKWQFVSGYDADKNFVGTVSYASSGTGYYINVPSNVHYIRIPFSTSYGTTYNNDISVNYPSTDTSYHAYNGQTITIDLDGTRYGGTLDVVNGVMMVDKVGIKGVTVARVGATGSGVKYVDTTNMYTDLVQNTTTISDRYVQINTSQSGKSGEFRTYNGEFTIYDDRFTDLATAQSLLNDVEFCYELATPLTIQLPTTQVKSLLGSNNVWADCGDICVTYVTQEYNDMTAKIAETAYNSIMINGHTVAKDVPSDAVFTDHHAWSDITSKPTTISGYGITDAKIASGIITLGSNTITPLTASSTLDATKLSGTIPSSCYTDTKNTAGSADTSSKIFLIGATSQAANPQTYSDNEVYTTSGVLTTKSVQVGGGSATMEYSATTKSINFVFAS